MDVRFTRNDDRLYATILGPSRTGQDIIRGLTARENTKITLLAQKQLLDWQNLDGGIRIEFPVIPEDTQACSLEITPVPEDATS